MTSSFRQGLIKILPYNWSLGDLWVIFQVNASNFHIPNLRTSKTWVTIRKPNKFLWNSCKSSILLAGKTKGDVILRKKIVTEVWSFNFTVNCLPTVFLTVYFWKTLVSVCCSWSFNSIALFLYFKWKNITYSIVVTVLCPDSSTSNQEVWWDRVGVAVLCPDSSTSNQVVWWGRDLLLHARSS